MSSARSARSQSTAARLLPDQDLHGFVLEERYRVGALLAKSVMARVYSGTDMTLRQPRVIKVASGRLNCARLEREVDLHRRVAEKASGLVKLCDRGWLRSGELFFAVFEYLDGQDLGEVLHSGGTLPLEHALRVTERVAAPLEELHAAGVVHRDIKPANIFLCRNGDVRLLDLGVARAIGYSPLTAPGEAVGTAPYLAYEQVAHPEEVDGRTDVFTLGLVLAHMVAGPKALPWSESLDPEHFLGALQRRPPMRRLVPSLPEDVTEVIDKACQLDPDARYQSMTEFRAALVALLDKEKEKQQQVVERQRHRRRMLIGVGAIMVYAAGLASGALAGAQWVRRQLALRPSMPCQSMGVPARPTDGALPPVTISSGNVNAPPGPASNGANPELEKDMNRFVRTGAALAGIVGTTGAMASLPGSAHAKPPQMCQADSDCKKKEACKSAGSLGMWCAEESKCASGYAFTKRAPKPVQGKCWIPYHPAGGDTGELY